MAKTIYSVGQVNTYIKSLFENDYALRTISVRGEISNCKYHSSGHIYFTLKDETGALSAVMFAGNRANGLRFQLEDGQQVVASGSVMVYEKTGQYQLYARGIVLDGVGDLYARFEETKKRLEEMGMFAPEYKKPIPKYAFRVGVVTASTGAAIQDIINISSRRNPFAQLYLASAKVQGEGSAQSVCEGIARLDKLGLDVIIVGRGGGSIEDLWAFNEEIVARAIFDATTPIISAVGHETDTTIADYVADLRAPTPSAAAELAVFDAQDYLDEIAGYKKRMIMALRGKESAYAYKLEQMTRTLERYSPRYYLDNKRAQLVNLERDLRDNISGKLTAYKQRLALGAAKLDSLSPLTRISSGYGYISKEGSAVKSIDDIKAGDTVSVYIKNGRLDTQVTKVTKETNYGG